MQVKRYNCMISQCTREMPAVKRSCRMMNDLKVARTRSTEITINDTPFVPTLHKTVYICAF